MRGLSILLVLLPACFWPFNTKKVPDRFIEETYLPYKQPNRDHAYPSLQSLRVDEDGLFKLRADAEWGYRKTVKVRLSHNSVTQYTSRSVQEVLHSEVALPKNFRLFSISAAFFKPSRRAFIDGKRFDCGSVCAELDAAIDSKKKFDLVMSFGTTPDELVVVGIEKKSCFTTFDCGARDECCATPEGDRCVPLLECPKDKKHPMVRKPTRDTP